MAEIPNSDSPDPLSSTPPRPGRFVVQPTISSISTPSTNSDLHSLTSESLDRQTRAHQHQHQHLHHRESFWNNTSPASAVTPPPMAFNDGNLIGLMRAADDGSDPIFERFDPEEEESLFVSDDDDYNAGEYDNDDLDLIEERNAGPRQIDEQAWVDDHSDDSYDDNEFIGILEENRAAANNNAAHLDELVEIEVMQAGNLRGNQGHRQRQPQAQPEVIDLTGDNDSPRQPAQPAPQNHSQNTRRQRSQQRHALPRLARSDASYMEPHNVIDLVSDSDESDPPQHSTNPRHGPIPPPRRGPLREIRHPEPRDLPLPGRTFGFPTHPNNSIRDLQQIFNNIPLFRLINNPPMAQSRDEEDIVIMGHRNLAPNAMPVPNLPPINLDVRVHPFANAPLAPGGLGAKPAHEPPKETREGFTRNTGEDVVAICPSCELELAYDPDDDDVHQGPPAKKARTKKDKAEHHFWAVKACGHVYCRACYENRKPVGKNPVPVGFRRDPNGLKNHVLCAVDDCETDVSAKSAWVGIFM
ncbi:uncharacterized protein GGS22DRAFT_112220 [Annulohypoxylon maeteangense]|uniref:uncharacterized protein n=1 Tax=Annulohypoxylon maeteangense TaxID=1927788 RepID=UPI002007E74B|nr:uncharacterized protein GGS22DRAFT_112220 [Annulohypoxylon maeteangense]KAI0887639.1 hypothetical protein GGS22DRAFT_112220 [Annulohypoxylon maeteangense]